eukprot:COSAG01_NODE_3740_length_5746_cov_2.375421_13_plen_62_part_01
MPTGVPVTYVVDEAALDECAAGLAAVRYYCLRGDGWLRLPYVSIRLMFVSDHDVGWTGPVGG